MVKEEVTSSTDSDGERDSWFASSNAETDGENQDESTPPVTDIAKPLMPRPSNEVPIYWKPIDESSKSVVDLKDLLNGESQTGLPPTRTHQDETLGEKVMNVRLVKVDTRESSETPRGIETLDLHSIVDLHKQLERERVEMPGELVVPGRVSGLGVNMLVDSGATVSVLSTALWEALHRKCPGWTMLSTDCCIRTVSGEFAKARGRVVLEVELGERFYTHQFIVMDIMEEMILGMDFIQKYQVDCNWRRGVLILKGDEVQACRHYSLGDARVRKLRVSQRTVVPANSQVIVNVHVHGGDPRGLPEWGMVSPAREPMATYGVMAGKALVDPRENVIPVPVINPGDSVVILPGRALLGFLIPIEQVGPPIPSGDHLQSENGSEVLSPVPDAADETLATTTDLRSAGGQGNLAGNRNNPDRSSVRYASRTGPEKTEAADRSSFGHAHGQTDLSDRSESDSDRSEPEWYAFDSDTDSGESTIDQSRLGLCDGHQGQETMVHSCLRCNAMSSTTFKVRALDPEMQLEEDECAAEYERRNLENATYPDTVVPRTLVRSPRETPVMEEEVDPDFYQKRWSDLSDSEKEDDKGQGPSLEKEQGSLDALTASVPAHLRELFKESAEQLQEEERPALAKFLREYEDVFAKDSGDLGRTKVVQHYIDTGDSRPIKQPPRRIPLHRKKVVQEEVEKMLERGVIEPCDSPWASPIVLAAKKDGSTRFCVDFRRVNDVTRKDAYPLPRIEDNLDTLQGAQYYSTLDLVSGFWQVEMAPEDRDKTAFTVGGGGLYRFLTMPFGLCNAPATFQRLMEHTLKGLQWETAVLYIDDIVVFSDTVESHYQRLGAVLDRLKKAGLKLKPSKCQLLRKKVAFLGHIVSAAGIEVDNSKIVKIQQWPVPPDLTALRSFVGLCAYYRRFVPNFSTVCKSLFDLTKKGTPFHWGPPQHKAFETMKTLLTSAPILGYPRREGLMILDCDASNLGIGAVLSQVQDDEEKVLAYASKTLGKAEKNYCVTRREMLAIVAFVKQFHHYLYGAKFLVRTDHAALYWLLRKKDPEGQMARWISFLQSYDLEIQHRPGKRHQNADALSRCMEGCRDLDRLMVPYGDQLTPDQIKELAVETVRKVTTRSRAKATKVERTGTPVHTEEVDQNQTERKVVFDDLSSTGRKDRCEAEGKLDKGPVLKPTGREESTGRGGQTGRSNPTGPDQSDRFRLPAADWIWSDKPSTRSQTLKSVIEASRGEVVLTDLGEKTGAKPKTVRSEKSEKIDHGAQGSRGETAQVQSHNSEERAQPCQRPVEEVDSDRLEQFFKEQLPDTWSDEAMSYLQDCDPDLNSIRIWMREGKRPDWNEVAKRSTIVKMWWARFDQLFLSTNGVLYLDWHTSGLEGSPWRRVVAVSSMFKAILREVHDAKLAGHLGQKKTIARLKGSPFYWPGMVAFARTWVANCVVCAAKKNPRFSKRTPMQPYRVGSTMDRVSIDLVGPFHPPTKRGSRTILTCTDQFTRWVEAFPLRDATAPEIARKVVDFICRKGVPLELHSDQGKNVDGEVMREVCRLLGVRKTHTTAYHPQGNAITERENSVIKAMLSAYVNVRLTDWDDHLPVVMGAMRSSLHRTLNTTPNMMMLGREVRLPLHAYVGPPPETEYEQMLSSEYAVNLSEAMQQAHRVVSEHMDSIYAYQKKNYDRQVKAETYKPGQLVWLRMFVNIKGRSKSLQKPWDYGWVVVAKLCDVTYRIQKSMKGKKQVVHGDRLKPFLGEITTPETLELIAWLEGLAS